LCAARSWADLILQGALPVLFEKTQYFQCEGNSLFTLGRDKLRHGRGERGMFGQVLYCLVYDLQAFFREVDEKATAMARVRKALQISGLR